MKTAPGKLLPWLFILLILSSWEPVFAGVQRQSRTLLQEKGASVRISDLDVVNVNVHAELGIDGYRDDSRRSLDNAVGGRGYALDLRYWNIRLTDVDLDVLIDDDGDAYYQGFRVSLDFAVDAGSAWLYTRMYISYEGGPWNDLHRSREFHVSSLDTVNAFEMTTLLDNGYPTGYYDIRLDLFDADTGRWLFSYGPYDALAFSSLPLEDQWRDHSPSVYNPSLDYDVSLHGGGSLGWWGLALFSGLSAIRRKGKRSLYPADH